MDSTCQTCLSFPPSRSLLKHRSFQPSCCPLLLGPSLFPSIRVFSSESAFASGGQRIRASASEWVLPRNSQNWFPLGDWFDLSTVQRTLKSLLQHHNLKASVLWCPDFFMVPRFLFFCFYILFIFIYFYLFVVDFVIHWNETAMGLHVFPIPIPPPTSLSTRSL